MYATWSYFQFKIVERVLTTNENKNEFWSNLREQVEAHAKTWEEYQSSIDLSLKGLEPKEVFTTNNTLSCAKEVQKQHYDFLKEELMDLSRMEHFWKLLDMKSQIEESVAVLRKAIDFGKCDM